MIKHWFLLILILFSVSACRMQSPYIFTVHSAQLTEKERSVIREYHPGGFLLLGKAAQKKDQLRLLLQDLYSLSAPDTPWIMVDEEGGKVSRLRSILPSLPPASERGEKIDPAEEQDLFRIHCLALRALGVNFNLAPVADLSRIDSTVLKQRTFSNDPKTVWTYAEADLLGAKQAGIAAAIKHFPGHGSVSLDSHKELPVFETGTNKKESPHLYPFLMAAQSKNCRAIMLSHIIWSDLDPEQPVSMSEKAVTFLRKELGFKGLLMSDDLSMGAVSQHTDLTNAIILSLRAGLDLLLISEPMTNLPSVLTKVESCLKLNRRIKDSTRRRSRRIMHFKRIYHLKDMAEKVFLENSKKEFEEAVDLQSEKLRQYGFQTDS